LHIEGNLIAGDYLADLVTGSIKGQSPEDFGFAKADKLADEIATVWGEAKKFWAGFKKSREESGFSESGTTETRKSWVVPLLYNLGYLPSFRGEAEVIDGQSFAISHRAGDWGGELAKATTTVTSPIHITGCRIRLDHKPPSGNPRLSAHGLMQEYLNRTEHLWGITTNGLQWRLLRDSSLMTRLTYIEFDLEQILEGENFAEFGLFYRLFHRSRLPIGMDDAHECLLEFYHQETLQQGGRVRDRLRDGVERAIAQLGNGFLQHPKNQALRDKFAAKEISDRDFYRQILLLIYRLLFLMVAESRNLLLTGEDPEKVRIYEEYYSIERLRALAEKAIVPRREGFQDLWQGLRVTFCLFDENWRGELLGLSPLNGDLFGSTTLPELNVSALDNYDLMVVIRNLSLYAPTDKAQLRRVNYAALDVEELGSVYESLLDFHPQVSLSQGKYEFLLVAGSDRKTTGAYYTPSELVAQLVKSALEPVIAERMKDARSRALALENEDKEEAKALLREEENNRSRALAQESALLSIKVCDPACGSGHFLLAAARRIGKELAKVRTGEAAPSPEPLREATRDVIQHCIYGVDINPLAVDLCKVALWIEGFAKGMPLNFLDHRIKCGNSLVGVLNLDVLKEGIPDEAFKAVTGDDKALSSIKKKANKQERLKDLKGQLSTAGQLDDDLAEIASAWQELDRIPENTPEFVKQKKERYEANQRDRKWWRSRSACNLWTAAFFMPLTEQNLQLLPTTAALVRLLNEDLNSPSGSGIGVRDIVDAANHLASEKGFFHWALEFPDVFENDGFDCILGNPPWERIKLQEKEFFASRDVDIAKAANKAEREKLIKTLPTQKPQLAREFEAAKHDAEAQSKFIRESNRFPLTAVGDVNTYAVFSETARDLIAGNGRAGIIVPTGIATDDTCKKFFGDLVQRQSLDSLIGFENEAFIFSEVHNAFKFCALVITGKTRIINATDFIFLCRYFFDIKEIRRHFTLTSKDIALINPNTLTCPIFRTVVDAKITKKIYQNIPVLENEKTGENPWGISFMRMLDMANDSNLFQNSPSSNTLPLYEAKMFWHYDHRFSTYENAKQADINAGRLPQTIPEMKQDSNFDVKSRYWINRAEVENRLANKWNKQWLIGFRDITTATNERTAIFSLLPRVVLGHTSPICFFVQQYLPKSACLIANFSSLVFDFITRQKLGGTHLTYFYLKQLPVLPPDRYSQNDINYITPRVLELTYTAWDIKAIADDLWNPTTPKSLSEVEGSNAETDSILTQASDKKQLKFALDIEITGKKQLELTTPPDPTHQTHLRQLILEQWQANRAAFPDSTQTPDNNLEGIPLSPFIWHETRRAQIRAELDAYYAKLYGLTREELRYILDPADIYGTDFPSETFRVLKTNEMKKYGEYRTQRLVLEAWDKLGY
jgi:hypothetical protein